MAIRLLHVGVGVRGRHWLDIVAGHPDFASVACVDQSEASLQASRQCRGQEHGQFFTSVADALARAKADAVLVATPTFMHAEHVIQALDAGLPVLVEKPLAANLEEAVRIVERARRVSQPVMVAENYRFYPAERTLRHMLALGVAGRLHWAECVDRRHQPAHSQGPWVKSMAHPFLTEIAVHHFDSFRYLFDQPPASISALSYNPPDSSYEREAAATAVIQLANGMPIQYGGTMTAARYEFALWIQGERGDLWTERRRVWWRPRGRRFFLPCRSVQVPKGDELPYPKAGTISILNQFRDALTHARIPETAAPDNLWTLAMVEASIRSHREARRIAIDEVLTPELKHRAGMATG